MKSFFQFIKEDSQIPLEDLELIKSHIITQKVLKGTVLLRKDEISTKTFYVVKGCLRSYSIDAKGKEHIFMFAPEGWIISDLESQLHLSSSQLYIDAVEDSEIEVFDIKILGQSKYIQTGWFSKAGVEKFLKRISVLQKRIIMLMSASAQERYEDFLQTYPNIVQRVPQRMIASYLGITPEALSKIRGEMAKNK